MPDSLNELTGVTSAMGSQQRKKLKKAGGAWTDGTSYYADESGAGQAYKSQQEAEKAAEGSKPATSAMDSQAKAAPPSDQGQSATSAMGAAQKTANANPDEAGAEEVWGTLGQADTKSWGNKEAFKAAWKMMSDEERKAYRDRQRK